MNKIKYLTAVILVSAAAMPAIAELSTTGAYLDGVVAIVNEGVVLRSDLDRQVEVIRQRAREAEMQLPPDDVLEEQVLERLIIEEVQMQRADRVGIQISDQMLNAAMAGMAQENGISFEELPTALAEQGLNYGEYRTDLRKQLAMDQLRRIEVVGRIAVSQREIDHCLEGMVDDFVINSEYNLSHILISVPDSATNEQYSEAEQTANDVYEQIQAGGDFAEMAVRHSSSQTALAGGALGWLKGGDLPSMFFEIMENMEPGQVSKPVRNVSGFHIVRINDLRSANQRSQIEQTSVRHILIMPNEIIDDATARQRLQETAVKIRAGEEDFEAMAKLMSDDPGSVNDGGNMGWTNPGTFVPEFEKVASTSDVGVVSDPFRTQFGWHVLEVLGRRTYDNTEDLRQNSCVGQIRAGKLANETDLWVRRLRDEAYVDIRI